MRIFLLFLYAIAWLMGCSNNLEPDVETASSSGAQSVSSSSAQAQPASSASAALMALELLNVQSEYVFADPSYKLAFKSLKIEEKAKAEFYSAQACGISFSYSTHLYDNLEFLVDGQSRFSNEFTLGSTYSEALPCGAHRFAWIVTKNQKDGVPDVRIEGIALRQSPDTSYAPEWSFEGGWPRDLGAKDWVASNLSAYQGKYSLSPGWMRDEEKRELRIPLPDTATKLNLYAYMGSRTTRVGTYDSASISIGERYWELSSYYTYKKFSAILRPGDSVAIVRFKQAEDGYADFHIDDIRALRYNPLVQEDRLWDFEDGFYPIEITGDWNIDNGASYEGDYSLRAPKGKEGKCGFDIDVGSADTLSFWNSCSYALFSSSIQFRIGSENDYISCPCGYGSAWKECTLPTRGQTLLHIETDCLPGSNDERRIDRLRVW